MAEGLFPESLHCLPIDAEEAADSRLINKGPEPICSQTGMACAGVKEDSQATRSPLTYKRQR